MRLRIRCDYCGTEFERYECQMKGKRHHFCNRKCLAAFSSKEKNPNGYASLKDFTNMSRHFSELNRELNPTRMTRETRKKLREAQIGKGEGKTYTKRYGRHEHRIVAEQILGRGLKSGEVVHHRDGNKRNNDPRNIVIFNSQSEHAHHHAELNWFVKEIERMEGDDAE